MKHLLKTVSMSALIMTTTLHQVRAEDNGPLVVELITRVGNVEAENRELRGMLDENRHEIAQLKQRLETINADVDQRLSTAESAAPVPHGASSNPIPIGRTVGADTSHETAQPFQDSETSTTASSSNGYETARSLLEQGDYEAAEKAFAGFVSAHPKDEHAGAAQYWLGVTFFVRNQHEKAAKAFAKGYKTYPKSAKAPDNLMKLAKSLAALDRNADACSTLDQLSGEYPKALVKEVSHEKKSLGCR